MNIELQAWSRKTATLPAETAAALKRSGLVDVRLGAAPGEWELVSDSKVGVAVAEGWELRVHPKLEIPKLLFLLAYARSPDGWRGLAGFGEERQLLDAVANGFAAQCQKAFERGLLRGYTPIEEARTDLRGRVRFGDQIARAAGLPLPIEVSYDNYTEDIPENRLLLTATELLLRLPRIGDRARPQLLAARAQLEAVSVLRDRSEFKAPPVTRLNKRYEAVMTLAELILHHASVTARQGQVASASFVFDLDKVFEDFVSTALKEALQPYGGEVRFQHPTGSTPTTPPLCGSNPTSPGGQPVPPPRPCRQGSRALASRVRRPQLLGQRSPHRRSHAVPRLRRAPAVAPGQRGLRRSLCTARAEPAEHRRSGQCADEGTGSLDPAKAVVLAGSKDAYPAASPLECGTPEGTHQETIHQTLVFTAVFFFSGADHASAMTAGTAKGYGRSCRPRTTAAAAGSEGDADAAAVQAP